MFWRKRAKCEHNFEITTRCHEHISYAGCLGVDIECYHITKAICVNCGFIQTLNTKRVPYAHGGELIAVHRDPLGIYHGILPTEKSEVPADAARKEAEN